MKFTNIKLVALIFSLLITFTACNKDDSIFQETTKEKAINEEKDTKNKDDGGEITSYRINGDKIVKIKDYKVTGDDLKLQNDTAKHEEIWGLVKKIVPLSHRVKINEFIIYNGEKNESSGYVTQTSNDLSTWQMGIAINFAYEGSFNANGQLAYTIIHEFGHVLTLEKSQVNSSISENTCTNFYTGEGCAKADSYINKLYNGFWKDIVDKHSKIGEDENKAAAFYTTYKDRFVTDYAATNIGEDIAEVFAVFVTRKEGVKDNSKTEQKIKLMYDSQELVSLRDYIRSSLNSKNSNSKNSRSFLPEPGSWKQINTSTKSNSSCCKHK